MSKTIIGKKVGMTQIFDEKGNVVPVTVIEAGPCNVVQIKTVETDGYDAVQLGYGEVKEHKVNKPDMGHFKKASVKAVKHLREYIADSIINENLDTQILTVGDGLAISIIKE